MGKGIGDTVPPPVRYETVMKPGGLSDMRVRRLDDLPVLPRHSHSIERTPIERIGALELAVEALKKDNAYLRRRLERDEA